MILGALTTGLGIANKIGGLFGGGGGGGGVSAEAQKSAAAIQQASADNSFISQATRKADSANTLEHNLTSAEMKTNETRRNSLDTALNAMSGSSKGFKQASQQGWS